MNNILVFAPHFDDESIACGGTIIKHVRAGDDVSIVFMTSGNSGSMSHQYLSQIEYGQLRKVEATAAMKVLGITRQSECLELDEGLMCPTPDLEKLLIAMIRRIKPDIVYVPHENENHNDHVVTYTVVTKVIHCAKWKYFPHLGVNPHKVSEIRAYEVWTPMQRPNLYVDITDVVRDKEKAIKCYQSQLIHYAYHDAIIGLNRYRGITGADSEFAEAFSVEKPLMVE